MRQQAIWRRPLLNNMFQTTMSQRQIPFCVLRKIEDLESLSARYDIEVE